MASDATFQPMPDLTEEQYAALRADIETNGVIVPVVVDQHGRTLDGHNRQRIAAELGINCPTEVREVVDDDAAMGLALTLNCARRHLNREQIREVIRGEIARRPGDSDRAIAKRVGCSPSTVGAVRKPAAGASNLDTPAPMSREDAEARTAALRAVLELAREKLFANVIVGLSNAIPATELVRALLAGQRAMEDRTDPKAATVLRRAVLEPVIEVTLAPETAEKYREQWDHETFKPLTDEEVDDFLDVLAWCASGDSPSLEERMAKEER